MQLHTSLTHFMGVYAQYTWLVQGGIILALTLIIHYVLRNFIHRLDKHLTKTHRIWDDTFVKALSGPLKLMVWFSAIALIIRYMLLDFEHTHAIELLIKVRVAGYLLIFAWFASRYITGIEQRLITPVNGVSKPADPTTVSVSGRLVRICLFTLIILAVLQFWGIPLTGILAFGGGGALAVGIAAQDLLANFFGGLMIFLDKPFKIGDWIESPDRNIQGTVAEIGWRLTKVITFDKRPLYIPNSIFTKIAIINPQRMTNRRIKTTVGLRYSDASKIASVVQEIKTMLQQHEAIDQHQTLMVHFNGFGASSLDIDIYCFTKTIIWSTWRDIQQDVFLKILAIVAAHDAEVAFPTRTLEIPQGLSLTGEQQA